MMAIWLSLLSEYEYVVVVVVAELVVVVVLHALTLTQHSVPLTLLSVHCTS